MDDEKKYGPHYVLAKCLDHADTLETYFKELDVYINNLEDENTALTRQNLSMQREINELRAEFSSQKMRERNL